MTKPAAPSSGARLPWLYFAMGGYALITQTALLRQYVVSLHGNELAVGLFFGWWFFGIALGAGVAARPKARPLGGWRTPVFLLGGAFLPVAMLVNMKYWLTPFASVGVVPGWWTVLLFGAFALPPAWWIGEAFPRFAGAATDSASAVGRLFVWEALGGLLGGLTFSFWLATHVTAVGSGLVAAVVLLLGAWLASPGWPSRWAGAIAAVLCLFLLILQIDVSLDRELDRRQVESPHTPRRFLYSLHTRYQSVLFAREGEQVQVFANGSYEDSFPDPVFYHLEAALLLSQPGSPRRVVLFGGGLTGLADAVLACPAVERVDLVQLDGDLTRHLLALLPPAERARLNDRRLRIIPDDVRHFARETRELYDLAVVVAPDPSTAQINRLYTMEFLRDVRRLLTPGGVLAMSLTGADNVMGEQIGPYVSSVYHTVRAVFPRVLALPGERIHLFASDELGLGDSSASAMKARYLRAFGESPSLPPALVDQWIFPERIAQFRRLLETSPGQPNHDLQPASYLAFLRVWDQFAGGGLAGLLRTVTQAPRWIWWLLAIIAMGGVVLAGTDRSTGGVAGRLALVSVATSGFVGMVVTILAALSYQSFFGQMYAKVALLVAAYMGGLAVGGILTAEAIRRGWQGRGVLLAGDVALAGSGGLFLSFLTAMPGGAGTAAEAALIGLVALSAACAGVAFPAAAAVLAKEGLPIMRRAGWVDAVDHAAALIGALTVGVILMPTVGLTAVCVFWIWLKAASAAAGIWYRKPTG